MLLNELLEDPSDQVETILTKSIKLLKMKLRIVRRMKQPTVTLITGDAGIGKTRGITYCVRESEPQPHTGLPIELIVEVPLHPTRYTLPLAILEKLGEEPESENSILLTQQVIKALRRNDIRLLCFDEGDRLNYEGFEVIKTIHDASLYPKKKEERINCRILIIGLDKMDNLLRQHTQLNSRVGIALPFGALDIEQILNTFLPNLDMPCWRFDATSQHDKKVGTYLWKRSRPDLRFLVTWICLAVEIAQENQHELTTFDDLKEAEEILRMPKIVMKQEEIKGLQELESELRNAAKQAEQSGK